MENTTTLILIVVGLIIAGLIFLLWNINQKRKEEERQKLFNFFRSKLDSITIAIRKFTSHLIFANGYFTNYQLTLWKTQNSSLYHEIKDQPFEKIKLPIEEVKTIKTFLKYFLSSEYFRTEYNKNFVKEELKNYSRFFDNIEERKLDNQQRTAVVTDEDNNIVIAGAGSGKTTTIVGKVNYIINRYKVPPEEILLVSFTDESVKDLRDRIKIEGVQAKTFHKFGIDVITKVEGKPSIFNEAQFKPLLTKFFTELIKNEVYLHKVTDYFTDFLKPPKTQFEFENQGDYIQYIKDKNFSTYKVIAVQGRGGLTYNMEVVKSIEECKIANFLLFNGLNYKYELPYEYDTETATFRQYKPDFTVIQDGRKVYIEHFGISRNGNVPSWFTSDGVRSASEKYRDGMNWKRKTHENFGTTLIETYSYEMSEDILFKNLTEHLTSFGITLTPKSPAEIWKIINDVAKDEVNSFIALFGTFITLMKSNNYSINDLIIRNMQTKGEFFIKRNNLFIEIIKPVFEQYENDLIERNEIDFSDMINKAAKYLTNQEYKKIFKYVIIDEFQDISIGRYKLVKAIKENNPTCKLFCVGDDWQSIYRFSGSDIALFKEFEKYFGYTVKSKIETTYRFYNPLIKLSSEFIQKNPNQAKKELRGTSNPWNTNYQIKYSISDNQDDTNSLKQIFNELIDIKENLESKKIFILGRYNFDIERVSSNCGISVVVREIINNNKNSYEFNYAKGKWKQLSEKEKIFVKYKKQIDGIFINCEAEYLTIHKAKGLEADIVIIINCNSGKHGFPSEMSDDTVLNLLLSEADQYENGEERRLFYVAMTRAKESVYFVADSTYKSKFIAELELENNVTKIRKCPRCRTADLIRRSSTKNGRQWAFWGCSNFLYGCDYREWENSIGKQ